GGSISVATIVWLMREPIRPLLFLWPWWVGIIVYLLFLHSPQGTALANQQSAAAFEVIGAVTLTWLGTITSAVLYQVAATKSFLSRIRLLLLEPEEDHSVSARCTVQNAENGGKADANPQQSPSDGTVSPRAVTADVCMRGAWVIVTAACY